MVLSMIMLEITSCMIFRFGSLISYQVRHSDIFAGRMHTKLAVDVGGGTNPVWHNAHHRFEKLCPQWDCLLVQVWDDDSTAISQAQDLIGSVR
eukprot:SAG31_NODE_50_length_30520_cov_89.906712_22_plen_93_part_00